MSNTHIKGVQDLAFAVDSGISTWEGVKDQRIYGSGVFIRTILTYSHCTQLLCVEVSFHGGLLCSAFYFSRKWGQGSALPGFGWRLCHMGFPWVPGSLNVSVKTSKQCPGLDFFRNVQRNEMIDNFHSVQVHHSWSLVTLCSLIMLLVVANKVPSDPSGSCVRGCGCGVTARARGHGIQIPGIASALPSFFATVAYEKLD